jgi:hypothetical protein
VARQIAERVLEGRQYAANINIKRPDKAALADLQGSILASLRNHRGKDVERTNGESPARWKLAS